MTPRVVLVDERTAREQRIDRLRRQAEYWSYRQRGRQFAPYRRRRQNKWQRDALPAIGALLLGLLVLACM